MYVSFWFCLYSYSHNHCKGESVDNCLSTFELIFKVRVYFFNTFQCEKLLYGIDKRLVCCRYEDSRLPCLLSDILRESLISTREVTILDSTLFIDRKSRC